MAEGSTPPPWQTLLAAAAGGAAGALLGVVAASTLTGDGDDGDSQAANEATQTEVVAEER